MNSETSITNSEQKHNKELLQVALSFAFERTGTEPYNLDGIADDVITEFPNISENGIKSALRNGGLGKYGRTYKLTTQEVCIWIRKYLEDTNKVITHNDPVN